MKKTSKSIARGWTAELKKRGVTIKKNGQAYKDGKRISKTSLQRRVAYLARTTVKMEKFESVTEIKPSKKKTIFERGPAAVPTAKRYKDERRYLRRFLGYEPTDAQIVRSIESRLKIGRKRKAITYDEVMERLTIRGVLDHAKLQKVSQRFGIRLHDVYGAFFGYPPSIGRQAA